MQEQTKGLKSLKDILLKDASTAKSSQTTIEALPAGVYTGKLLGITEEEKYSYITLEINKVKRNYFYNIYLRNSDDLNADVFNWLQSLATVAVTEQTSLLEIINSAIGFSFEIKIYNYVSKSSKDVGKTKDAIDFTVLPKLVSVGAIQEEVIEDLPF